MPGPHPCRQVSSIRSEANRVDWHVYLTRQGENVGNGFLAQRFARAIVINTVAEQHYRLAAGDGAQ